MEAQPRHHGAGRGKSQHTLQPPVPPGFSPCSHQSRRGPAAAPQPSCATTEPWCHSTVLGAHHILPTQCSGGFPAFLGTHGPLPSHLQKPGPTDALSHARTPAQQLHSPTAPGGDTGMMLFQSSPVPAQFPHSLPGTQQHKQKYFSGTSGEKSSSAPRQSLGSVRAIPAAHQSPP